MHSRLPATPLEALKISTALKVIVKTVHTVADIFGFWKRPSKKAAADFEQMSLLDKMYWGYKSKKPVRLPEKGLQQETQFINKKDSIDIPDTFVQENTVTIGAAGDLIKVDGLEHSSESLYAQIAPLLFDKDISYGNLESQMTGQDLGDYIFSDKETPPLCCTTAQYDTLKQYKGKKMTVMHTACNHTLDMGLEGLETTLSMLENDHILDLGTNRRKDMAEQGRIIEINGIKIGFISATFGLNGKEVPAGKEYMVNVVKFHPHNQQKENPDLSLLEKQINDCKSQHCDFIIASLHWGYEYEHFPRIHQVRMAHRLVESGVDAIIGHHSHVLQPVEFYRPRRDLNKTAVIAYSLGNLTSSFSAPHLVLSGILNLEISKGKLDGKIKTLITAARLHQVKQEDFIDDSDQLPKIRLVEIGMGNER